jgi:hypothetical protein
LSSALWLRADDIFQKHSRQGSIIRLFFLPNLTLYNGWLFALGRWSPYVDHTSGWFFLLFTVAQNFQIRKKTQRWKKRDRKELWCEQKGCSFGAFHLQKGFPGQACLGARIPVSGVVLNDWGSLCSGFGAARFDLGPQPKHMMFSIKIFLCLKADAGE